MSVHVSCPACNEVVEWHQPPVAECPRCTAPYPAALRTNTESALRRTLAPKPMVLLLGQIMSLVVGSVLAVFLILAPFDIGTYTINQDTVSGPEFLRRAGAVFALGAGLLIAIGVGLWRENAWTRPLMLSYWLAIPLGTLSLGDSDAAALAWSMGFALIAGGLAAGYLYGSHSAVAYFEARKLVARDDA